VDPPLHVSNAAFEETLRKARNAGFKDTEGINVLFTRTVILKKG
jgi:hypothetical protein